MDVSLDQACMLARSSLGGAAAVRLARTGREFFTTVVTTNIPQYISKPNLAYAFVSIGTTRRLYTDANVAPFHPQLT
jgi:hypothetical protein